MRHLKLTERMLDAIRPLRPNEVHVYLRLALMCRKPYGGDPKKGIPPTPPRDVLCIVARHSSGAPTSGGRSLRPSYRDEGRP